MDRRRVLEGLTAGALSAIAPRAFAQGRQTILRIVVPYAAGGSTDVIARLLASSMETTLGRRVLVDNRPGAAALIGTKVVQSAAPDGDTLLSHNAGLVALPMLSKSADYDPLKDFEAVAMTGIGPNFLMVTDSVPAKNITEFLAYARTVPQGIECANSGINSGGHIAAMMLEKRANIKLLHVPFKGAAEVTRALLSGEVKMQVSTTTDSLNPYIKSGQIRILGVATKMRTTLVPDVPTIGEFVPGYSLDGWFGILAPANTPLATREVLSDAIGKALADPTIKGRCEALYMEVAYRAPREFAVEIAESVTYFKNVVQELQLTAQ